jgi:hypothetical protein
VNRAQRHVIRRECIDIVVAGTESDGLALQGKVAELCRNWLAPALDEAFERVAPGGEHWQFERIEVDAGSFTPETFEREFVAAVTAAVEKRILVQKEGTTIPEHATGGELTRQTGAQSIHAAFLYFLATGALPWWCHLPAGRTLEAMVCEGWGGEGPAGPPRAAMLDLFAAPVVRLRLARQFSAGFLGMLLERLAPGAPAALRDFEHSARPGAPGAAPHDLSEHAWVAAFACLAARRSITQANVLDAWAAIAPADGTGVAGPAAECADDLSPEAPGEKMSGIEHGATRSASLSAEARAGWEHGAWRPEGATVAPLASGGAELDLREGVYVGCAGLVLLHPFLPTLFERLRVCADGELAQPDRALALLHFLATGETSAPEHALVLPKMLCGLEPAALAGQPVGLGEQDRLEALELLKSAIGHWDALGDTSPDALRGTFLVRPGKLSRRDDDDLLQVELQAYDVLLGRLPWGIGPVRLPWMKRFLWVEWPY